MQIKRQYKNTIITALVGAFTITGLGIFGLLTTPERNSADTNIERVLSVKTLRAVSATGYEVSREFVGRVEARRESRVGFELGGLLTAIYADEGDFVDAGQALAVLDTQILRARRDELVATRNRARADSELARSTLKRNRIARSLNAVSAQALDEAERTFTATQAALQQAEAAIRSIDVQLEKSFLKAPYDAMVARRFVDEGQVIAAGTPVLFLLERTAPEVRIGVAGDAVDRLQEGATHDLLIRGRRVPATVRSIVPLRDRGTRSVDVIFNVQVPFNGIRRGDLARFETRQQVDTPGFWLPLSALTESSRGLWAVYVAVETDAYHKVLERRELEILYQEANRVFARGSLEPGERVVAGGMQRLVPGQAVTLARPAGYAVGGKERAS